MSLFEDSVRIFNLSLNIRLLCFWFLRDVRCRTCRWKWARRRIVLEICISVGKIVTPMDKLQVRAILAEYTVEKLYPAFASAELSVNIVYENLKYTSLLLHRALL